MKKIIAAGLVIIIVQMLTATLHAQIYKYVDKNGQQRWTDDLSQVPVEQRESAEHFESVSEASQPEPKAKDGESEATAAPAAVQGDDRAQITRESLLKDKTDLQNQYQRLMDEREQIEQMRSEEGKASHRAEIDQKISAFNAKTKQYEMQLNAYKQKVEAYKQKMVTTDETAPQ